MTQLLAQFSKSNQYLIEFHAPHLFIYDDSAIRLSLDFVGTTWRESSIFIRESITNSLF